MFAAYHMKSLFVDSEMVLDLYFNCLFKTKISESCKIVLSHLSFVSCSILMSCDAPIPSKR